MRAIAGPRLDFGEGVGRRHGDRAVVAGGRDLYLSVQLRRSVGRSVLPNQIG